MIRSVRWPSPRPPRRSVCPPPPPPSLAGLASPVSTRQDALTSRTGTVTGWGRTSERGPVTSVLREVQVMHVFCSSLSPYSSLSSSSSRLLHCYRFPHPCTLYIVCASFIRLSLSPVWNKVWVKPQGCVVKVFLRISKDYQTVL